MPAVSNVNETDGGSALLRLKLNLIKETNENAIGVEGKRNKRHGRMGLLRLKLIQAKRAIKVPAMSNVNKTEDRADWRCYNSS